MEKKYFIFNKSISVLIILLILNILIYISTNSTNEVNANNNNNNNTIKTMLLYENQQLRNNYKKLEQKIIKLENELNNIEEYDTYLYSQLLGLDVDSIQFKQYLDSINYESIDVDSLFNKLDKKTLLMSKIVSKQLNQYIKKNEIINKNTLNLYPNQSPIPTKDIVEITSGFGWRKHPIYKTPIFHEGVDIAVKLNTKIYSTMSGRVVEVKYSKYGYGNKIVIKNSGGFETLYAHLSNKIYVKKGQIVKKGQLIATSGNTGTSTGPHLHYEIRKQNELKDPLGYFYSHITTKQLLANK